MRVTTFPKDSEGESFVSLIVHYDRLGNEIARNEYKGPDEFESKVETRYDENSKVIEETTWQDEHEIMERKVYTRDERGRVTRVEIEYADGSLAVQTVELSHPIAILAYALPGTFHKDPADRILVATAIHQGLTLVTADERILAYRNAMTLDARR